MAREKSQENKVLANKEIRAKDVRLIDEDGTNIGVVPYFRALGYAQEKELDLILINGASQPIVCKIGDLGKYKYEQQKRQKEQDRKTRENRVDLKEVQLRPAIDQHDLNIKIKHIHEWITGGDKVKVVVKFRGREMANQDAGHSLINAILEQVPNAQAENRTELMGNKLVVILSQGKNK